MVLHVFISFLGGVPLCIPYGLYSGTPLGGTTQGTLEGYPGRVLSLFTKIGQSLLCTGSSTQIQTYPKQFNIIQYKYQWPLGPIYQCSSKYTNYIS